MLYSHSRNQKPNWTAKFESIIFSKFTGNTATKYGKRFESLALKLYAGKNEDEVITDIEFIIKVKSPWSGFSADGFHKTPSNEIILLEVKCPVQVSFDDFHLQFDFSDKNSSCG